MAQLGDPILILAVPRLGVPKTVRLNTIDLLGFWETIYNSGFKPLEFEGFRKQAGLNNFVMTRKRWVDEITNCESKAVKKLR